MRKRLSRPFQTEWVRFAAVGAINTGVGYVAMLAAHHGMGLPPHAANLLGYVLAGACSYLLNRRFTFRSERRHTQAMVWFAGVWLLCFGLNNLALGLALKLGWPFPLAALAGMVTFTVSFYALCRTWVFPRPQAPE